MGSSLLHARSFFVSFAHLCRELPLLITWMCTSSAFLSIQASGVERRKLRLPLHRVFLWQCHRPGLPRKLHLLRRLTPVKCVVQSWEAFSIWLSSREHNTARNYWSARHVQKDFVFSFLIYFMRNFCLMRSSTHVTKISHASFLIHVKAGPNWPVKVPFLFLWYH